MSRPLTLTFEIGTEEMPSADVYAAVSQLSKLVPNLLEEARLVFEGEVRVFATPCRLIVMVTKLREESEEKHLKIRGPAKRSAYDENGVPTKALEGFSRSKGVSPDDLIIVNEDGIEYLYAVLDESSRPTIELLPDVLQRICASLKFKKSQRWGSGTTEFVRPVRWLLALFGPRVVPFTFAGLTAGRLSHGHKLLSPEAFSVASAEGLIPSLENVYVVPRIEARGQLIKTQISTLEERLGAHAVVPDAVFKEVVNLVENPTVGVGRFDEEFLEVPREIISDAMLSHQRYFPVEDAKGALTNYFIVVHNGDPERSEIIIAGHEKVIRARLSDAAFFYHEDLKVPLEAYVSRLDDVTFQKELGSVAAKVNRMLGLTGELARLTRVDEDAALLADALRATFLCKADLVTSAVTEFPSLQGVMGGYYATASGENDRVARAIVEHYRPRHAGDVLPEDKVGDLVALSDKLDTIAGLFAAGQPPTGSSDPFALRRAAIGVLNIAISDLPLDLHEAICAAVAEYEGTLEFQKDALVSEIQAFFTGRLEQILKEEFAYDTVAAVLATNIFDPREARLRCAALQNARDNEPELFVDLATAFTRASKLTDRSLGTEVDHALLSSSESALFAATVQASAQVAKAVDERAYDKAYASLATLRGPIDTFFEDVLVMDPDEHLRENRLRLLNAFVKPFDGIADFSQIGGGRDR